VKRDGRADPPWAGSAAELDDEQPDEGEEQDDQVEIKPGHGRRLLWFGTSPEEYTYDRLPINTQQELDAATGRIHRN
jgi:hypothetical protein